MTTYIALIRGINVGGNKLVSMAGLRDLMTALDLRDGKTLLQSGNLVFKSAKKPDQLEKLLQRETAERLGVDADFFLRTADEWRHAIDRNPFPAEAKSDPGRLLLMALRDAPARDRVEALQNAIRGSEVVRVDGRHAYFVYPDGQGRSKLTNAVIEKTLATRGTARNWNTVVKLAGLI